MLKWNMICTISTYNGEHFFSQVFRDYHLYGDPTTLHPLAHALWSLQALYGTIPTVYGKGRAARQVVDFANRMRKELVGAGRQPKGRSQIQQVVIIDRQVGQL